MSKDEQPTGRTERKCWACGRPVGNTLDLTEAEVDALYEHLMDTEQNAEPYVAQHLSSILDKLPEREILTRDPPAELRAELLMDRSVDTDRDPEGSL